MLIVKIAALCLMGSFCVGAVIAAVWKTAARKEATRRRGNIHVIQEPQKPAIKTCDFDE
jgi:hypothetical protein